MSRKATVLLGAAGLLLTGCSAAGATAASVGTPATGVNATTATTSNATPAATAGQATVIEVRLAKGAVTPPTGRVKVPLGTRVVIRFTSDVADTVHVHGYDVEQSVRAGSTTDIAFVADLQGSFEVETHDSTMVLMQLQVS